MDLEQKLTVAKEELEKTALDKVTDWGRGHLGHRSNTLLRCIDGNRLGFVVLICA